MQLHQYDAHVTRESPLSRFMQEKVNIVYLTIETCIPKLAAAVRLSPRLTCSQSHHIRNMRTMKTCNEDYAPENLGVAQQRRENHPEHCKVILSCHIGYPKLQGYPNLPSIIMTLKHLLVCRFNCCQDGKLLPHVTKQNAFIAKAFKRDQNKMILSPW